MYYYFIKKNLRDEIETDMKNQANLLFIHFFFFLYIMLLALSPLGQAVQFSAFDGIFNKISSKHPDCLY